MKHSKNMLYNLCSLLFIISLVWTGAACDQATMPDLDEGADAELSARTAMAEAFSLGSADISGDVAAQLAEVRRLTAPFHNIQKAAKAGWVAPLSPCVADSELGGMGYHIGNMEYLMNGILDPLMPEVLLYEPMKNGRLRLVGVEYIVPFGPPDPLDPGAGPITGEQPWLFGQPFDFSPHVPPNGAWTLHVWLWRNNPEGMFAEFNPNVSCDYSTEP